MTQTDNLRERINALLPKLPADVCAAMFRIAAKTEQTPEEFYEDTHLIWTHSHSMLYLAEAQTLYEYIGYKPFCGFPLIPVE